MKDAKNTFLEKIVHVLFFIIFLFWVYFFFIKLAIPSFQKKISKNDSSNVVKELPNITSQYNEKWRTKIRNFFYYFSKVEDKNNAQNHIVQKDFPKKDFPQWHSQRF